MYDKADHGGGAPLRTCEIVVGAGLEPHVEVRADNYPALHETLNSICHDSGMGAGHDVLYLSQEWEHRFAPAEAALAALRAESQEDFEDFAIGEYSDAEAIADRSPELTAAHGLLNDFFGEE